MQHQSVLRAYRKKNPERWQNGGDEKIWEKGKGFLVPVEQFPHGAVVWVEVEGRECRLQARICRITDDLVFAEDLKRLRKTHNRPYSWIEIKAAMRRVYQGNNGHKPEDVSWNDAIKEAIRFIENDRMPSLMSQRSCAPCLPAERQGAVGFFVRTPGLAQRELAKERPIERLTSLRACAPAI